MSKFDKSSDIGLNGKLKERETWDNLGETKSRDETVNWDKWKYDPVFVTFLNGSWSW